ncbi:hypothetical protein [Nitrosomonas sp.]|uniref:hypothetical protein n=1 Tax=Nitrosomonas sp. TaxID=42353 RepID=UPI001D20AB13|nr:hypothetical protein [Nitrosomonas sp.]MBX3617317.1 hypothetical protein [Nitrosomonas sp.]
MIFSFIAKDGLNGWNNAGLLCGMRYLRAMVFITRWQRHDIGYRTNRIAPTLAKETACRYTRFP